MAEIAPDLVFLRMPTGKTKSSGWQMGLRKTLPVSPVQLWELLNRPVVMKAITGNASFEVTTFREGSHLRMKWQLPEWEDYSVLQIRVIDAKEGKSTLAFHQERLSGEDVRNQMKAHWEMVMAEIVSLL